jgi:hypothetical protein
LCIGDSICGLEQSIQIIIILRLQAIFDKQSAQCITLPTHKSGRPDQDIIQKCHSVPLFTNFAFDQIEVETLMMDEQFVRVNFLDTLVGDAIRHCRRLFPKMWRLSKMDVTRIRPFTK